MEANVKILALLLLTPTLALAQGLCANNVVGNTFTAGSTFKAGKAATGESAIWVGAVGAQTKATSTIWNTGSATALNSPGNAIYIQTAGNTVLEYSSNTFAIANSGGSLKVTWKCDSSGSPGAATCNEGAGRAAFAAGTGSAGIAITNSLVTATTIILANLQTSDAGCTGVKAIVPAAGSFTIYTPANCTGIVNFGWFIASR
jgi:hypothetical protein